MSLLTNQSNVFVPVREQRGTTGTLAALNAEVVHAINGDESALLQVSAGAAVTATIVFEGSIDGGVNYFPVLTLPYAQTTGTINIASQVMITEAFSAVAPFRVYAMATGGLTHIKVRASAWTSGTLSCVWRSGPEFSIHPNTFARCSTLNVTVTAAVGVLATATMPLVTGLRHYIDRISIVRLNATAAALTAGTAGVLVTTANIPGNPIFTLPSDALAAGATSEFVWDAGSTGCACTAIGTATSITAPATTGVIWRINVLYRLGL